MVCHGYVSLRGRVSTWGTFKTLMTCHYTDWFLGILTVANETPHIMGCYLIIHYIQQIARVLFSPNRLQEKRRRTCWFEPSYCHTAISKLVGTPELIETINMLLGGRGEHEKYSPAKLTWHWNITICNRKYIDSFMVEFPASHVSELGAAFEANTLMEDTNQGWLSKNFSLPGSLTASLQLKKGLLNTPIERVISTFSRGEVPKQQNM